MRLGFEVYSKVLAEFSTYDQWLNCCVENYLMISKHFCFECGADLDNRLLDKILLYI